MKNHRLSLAAIAVITAAGCSSTPPRIPPTIPAVPPMTEAVAPPPETAPEAKSRHLTLYLGSQTFDYQEDDQVVRTGPISSGRPGTPTPAGSFRVLSKRKDKVSSLYTNELGMQAWMPYSMQFYGNYFIHEGWLPDHAASHGCVRVGYEDAKFLFGRMKIGDGIQVTDQ